jgi:phytoene synthase
VSENTFDECLAHWRAASHARAIAWLFLRPDERIRFGGVAALQQEWLRAIRDINEPQVAMAKLGWWREEMQRAVAGEARHPLTQGLFADARIRAVPLPLWTAGVEAAVLAIDAPPAADVATQRAAVAPLAAAFAAQETCVAFGLGAVSDGSAAVWAAGILVANLRALASEVGHGRSPVPMNLLARHGLTREELLQDSPARRSALRDYVVELQRALADAAKIPAPLTLFRSVQLRSEQQSLRLALRNPDPLRGLHEQRSGLRDVLKTWRAARISRQLPFVEKPDATT